MKPETKVRIKKEIREWAETIVVALLLATVIRTYVIQAFKIPSGSMLQTLQLKDHLFVNKFIYGTRIPFTQRKFGVLRTIQRGDVIVFKYPQDMKKDYVKRCIGIPGDKIEIKNKVVYRDDQRVEEPYVVHSDERVFPNHPDIPPNYRYRDNFGPITVPEGKYLVFGDNRDNSWDSRFWGFVPEKNIRGKAWFIYWPLTRIRIIK